MYMKNMDTVFLLAGQTWTVGGMFKRFIETEADLPEG